MHEGEVSMEIRNSTNHVFTTFFRREWRNYLARISDQNQRLKIVQYSETLRYGFAGYFCCLAAWPRTLE